MMPSEIFRIFGSVNSGSLIFWAAMKLPNDLSEPQIETMKNGATRAGSKVICQMLNGIDGTATNGNVPTITRSSRLLGVISRASSQPARVPISRQYIRSQPRPQMLVPTMAARDTNPTSRSCQSRLSPE